MANQHPLIEDIFALVSASGLVSLAVFFLNEAGLLNGGTTGLALVLTKIINFSFGQIFFAVNLPFYLLAWFNIGKRFTINTFVAIGLISICVDYLPRVVTVSSIDPVYAAVIAGVLAGVGMLILFRHNSSLGGFGILALFLMNRFQIPAGRTMLMLDLGILAAALFLFPFGLVVLSVISAAFVSFVLILNHKPYRYQLR